MKESPTIDDQDLARASLALVSAFEELLQEAVRALVAGEKKAGGSRSRHRPGAVVGMRQAN